MRRSKRFQAAASVVLCVLMLAVFVSVDGQSLPRANAGMNLDFGLVFGESETTQEPAGPTTFTPSARYPYADMKATINSYASVNPDVKGWLTVPGTNMDYPILLSTRDNTYYEYRDWRGNHYPNTTYLNYTTTAIYMDFRTRLGATWQDTSKNIVLYGHNWNNLRDPMVIGDQPGYTMFAQLPSYVDQSFAQANPYIYFSTGENEGVWKVFSVAYCELSADFFYNNPNPSTAQYQSILDEWQARTMYNFGVDVNTDDRILTLTTCTRRYEGISSYQRYCVVARLLRPGESENDPVTVSVNSTAKAPDFSRIGQTSTAATVNANPTN